VIHPVEARTADPIERVFALLAQYRGGMRQMGCRMGCPIGNLALEVSDDHVEARQLIHQNFENWAAQVETWLVAAGDRLPEGLDRKQLARFILTVMEGGLMQARAGRDLALFDDSVAQLRGYVDALQQQALGARQSTSKRTRKMKTKSKRGSR
jgi:TetR/AcrR family transcriptional repressor of nem operon